MSQHDDDKSRRYDSQEESDTKPTGSSSQPRKRASRAGTRSVSNLSPAQLERKRANDREAQRSIRQRTKGHIKSLEEEVLELTRANEQSERLIAANQGKMRELEQENAFLRSRMGSEAYLMQLPNNEPKAADSALGHSAQTSPQTRFTAEQVSRPNSQAARPSVSGASSSQQQSRPETWRQQTQPHVFSPAECDVSNTSRPGPTRTTSWRNPSDASTASSGHSLGTPQSMEQAQRSFSTPNAHERPAWAGNPNYQYMMDPNQQSGNFSASGKAMAFQGHSQQGQYPMQAGVPTAQAQQGYGGPAATPSAEFSALSMQSPPNQTAQHDGDHSQYSVQPGHMQPGQQAYPATGQQASMTRAPALSPGFTQQSGSTPYPQPGMTQTHHLPIEYQGAAGQPGYSYGSYHGSG